jgi:hypothetical protein
MKLIHKLLDRNFFAFQMPLNAAIGGIADPPLYAQLIRFPLSPRSEEDALHSASHSDAERNLRHHTVAMSGASSAFIPTTLYPASTWWISPVTPEARSLSR